MDTFRGGNEMQDLIFIGITLVFFVLAMGYVRFCERIH